MISDTEPTPETIAASGVASGASAPVAGPVSGVVG
jgi:hypothetical protein